jgi:outer membrane beta-barrel protein
MKTLVLVALLLSSGAAFADDLNPSNGNGRLFAIQQKRYSLGYELTIGGLFEPQDAFSKGLGVEGAFTWHLGDELSWEVVRGAYLAQLDSGLKTQLQSEFGVAPTQFELLQYYLSSSLMWAPLYGKFALHNASIVHAEAFVDVGAALGRYTNQFAEGPVIGVGARVFLNQRFSVRLDARDAIFFHAQQAGSSISQAVLISLGLSVTLGGNGG